MKKIIAILFLILLANCQRKETELEFEKRVMNDLFIDLIDSIYVDSRTMKIPSPNLRNVISDSLKTEKLKKYKKYLVEREKRIIQIKNDTSKVVIAIDDTISKIRDKSEYKIDLLKINENDKYIFKYYSDFPKGKKTWTTEYPYHFGGIISLERIKFNENKDYGELSVAISYFHQDAAGFNVFIKKDSNNKWIIEKIITSWIS